MALPSFLRQIISWLRAGYPEGVPSVDYIPLFALLGSQLTEDEVKAIAAELEDSADPACAGAIRAAIKDVTHARPGESDIARVRARLAAGGWPLAPPQRVSQWP
ncbi:MAG TPA: DUF3349 domain-containing protein [Streptosporangiaceae bacterium]|nr:DUF3349 domain-containing protein [Streptosporangiaceae bacterium]